MNKFFGLFLRYNSWVILSLLTGISLFVTAIEKNDVPAKVTTAGSDLRAYLAERLGSLGYLLHIKEENQRLLQQNSRLLGRLLLAESALREQNALERLQHATPPAMQRFSVARVVDRTFSDRENMLLLDRGRRDGVRKDMTVLTPEGLVGRVTRVSAHYSSVMPLIHSDFKVSVVSSASGTTGLASWEGGREDLAYIEHVPISSSLAEGEEMLTTDFSTFAVPGVPVGRVISVKPGRLFSTVTIRPSVDFSRLGYVLLAPLSNEPEKLRMLGEPAPGEENQ
ncbi:rod shape-determining protein MreC [Chlorobium sp. N1]|uniref:rod shape-determining protein MreC n=1 Tax=Chlorobium sp. N1 TaxID=2491138 RepID=UPI001040B6B6|nr:rod shape-determining protein MreC [Chlorobium sp. N1]TCD47083.1 rod shape-determining protein MreC [Chlorobium sp. N1]